MKNGKRIKGTYTVEMSVIVPVILFVIMTVILIVFYYHDKDVISSTAYETAVVGSTKAREKEGVTSEELQTLFQKRIKGKCILFGTPKATVTVGEDEILVNVVAKYRYMKVSVTRKGAVTEPEQKIRKIRKAKSIVNRK